MPNLPGYNIRALLKIQESSGLVIEMLCLVAVQGTPMPYTPCFIQLQNEFLDEAAGGGGMVQEEHKYKISFKKE